jgi:hypothetical protein
MRGAASAPCTPNRKKEEDGGVDRFHKFQQLKMFREPQQQVERISSRGYYSEESSTAVQHISKIKVLRAPIVQNDKGNCREI